MTGGPNDPAAAQQTERTLDWARLADVLQRDVHVIGVAGTEGAAIARFLADQGARRLTLHDLAAEEDLEAEFKRQHVGLTAPARRDAFAALLRLDATWRLGDAYLGGVDAAQVVFAPQAWYLYARNLAALGALRARGVPFFGLMDLYFGLAAARIVAVTGSNGKSTTSRLIEHLLKASPHRVFYAGNERRSVQVLDALHAMSADDRLVLEVSNRHLIDLAPRPFIGVVTNVLPNHLDEHDGDFAAYAAVKRKAVAHIPPGGWAVLNADNDATLAMATGLAAPIAWFSRRGEVDLGVWAEGGVIWERLTRGATPERLASTDDVALPGAHNLENALAAIAAARLAGVPADAISPAIRTFRGLRHRTQLVWATGGVRYFDDLNSTTPQATVAALEALTTGPDDRSVVLLIGGDDKGLDTSALVDAIERHVRWLIVLPGPGGERIAANMQARAHASSHGPAIERIDRLGDAVAAVVAGARPGETVLLSPACPYFFRRHYLDGGAEVGFRQLLRAATGSAPEAPKALPEDQSD
ncbi:MAG: UDP-N-acetylmuramoyl-L-alanine--D-glutamate ligase [Ardenticatenales bacterium]